MTDNNGNLVNNADLKYEIKSGDVQAFEIKDGNTVKAIEGGKEATLQISLKEKPSVKVSVKIGSVQEIAKIEFVKDVYTINDTIGYEFNPIITLKGGEVLDPQDSNVKNSDKYKNLLANLVLTEVDGDGEEKERTEQLVKITKGGKEVVAKESGNCYLGYKSTINPNVTAKTELQISLLGEQGDMVKSLFNAINDKREELGLDKLKWSDKATSISEFGIDYIKKSGSVENAKNRFKGELSDETKMSLVQKGINNLAINREFIIANKASFEELKNSVINNEHNEILKCEYSKYLSLSVDEIDGKLIAFMISYATIPSGGKTIEGIRYINNDTTIYSDCYKQREDTLFKQVTGTYVKVRYKTKDDMVKILPTGAIDKKHEEIAHYWIEANRLSEINPRVDRSNAIKINDTRWANKDGVELRTYPSNQDEYKYNAVIETVDKGTELEIVEKYPDSWCLVKYEGSYLYVFADNLNAKKM